MTAFQTLKLQLQDLSASLCHNVVKFPAPQGPCGQAPGGLHTLHACASDSRSWATLMQYTIAQILMKRIFEPFLFTISRCEDRSDQLFKEISQSLATKGAEQEASWRQQISHAAYTAPNAHQSVNKTAANIVDETLGTLDDLMYVQERTKLVAAVRNVVKTAAEAWRYAR